MSETVRVCNRCGSMPCWETGKAVCALDGLPREYADVPRVKYERQPRPARGGGRR